MVFKVKLPQSPHVEMFQVSSFLPEPQGRQVPLFFTNKYLSLTHDKPILFQYHTEKQQLFLWAVKVEDQLISLPKSPFGGFFSQGKIERADFENFINHIQAYISTNNIRQLLFHQPPPIFTGMMLPSDTDFPEILHPVVQEDHQYIDLMSEIKLHPMQKRNLDKLQQQQVIIRNIAADKWPRLHALLAKSRERKKLKINLDLERLLLLVKAFPNNYQGWIAQNGDQWLAGLVTVKVTDEVVYYFLPGNFSETDRPGGMVLLVDYTTKYFKNQGFHTYDLGISSIQEKRQEGLLVFKSRMGAQAAHRTLYLIKRQ